MVVIITVTYEHMCLYSIEYVIQLHRLIATITNLNYILLMLIFEKNNITTASLYVLVSPQAVMNKANLYVWILIDVLLALAVVSKNN